MTVTSFAILIALGTIALLTPWAWTDPSRGHAIDAFFLATSAVCVTGLSPVVVNEDLSLFGQIVLLALMQLGGLGLMTFTTTLYVWLGERMSITERLTVQDNFLPNASTPIKRILGLVLAFTFISEAVGAALLTIYWSATSRFSGFGQTLWMAVFHSVSAFTNGSLTLFRNSLEDFRSDYFVLAIVSGLIILGGLGFLVVFELKEFVRHRIADRTGRFRIGVQTRLTLITTIALIIVGTVAIYILERNGAFAEMTSANALLNAYFFSVVPRTSGFSTVPMGTFGGATCFVLTILMFIGASPGSTGGGIKTTTFGLLVAYTFARFRGKPHLDLWNRTIPQTSVDKATAVVVASATTVLIGVLVLMFTETGGMTAAESQKMLLPVVFETISAFGTVGLSLDFTPHVSTAGKLVLIFLMFVGRVGAITLALAISLRSAPAKFTYAEENVMIG